MPFFKYGAKSGKCKPGKIVPSDAALIYALETEPSVWWTMTTRPTLYIHLWCTQTRWEWCVNGDCANAEGGDWPDAYGHAADFTTATTDAHAAYDRLVTP